MFAKIESMEPVKIEEIDGAIRIGYSGKALGNVRGSDGEQAKVNFAQFVSYFPDKELYDMPAVGGDRIVDVDALSPTGADSSRADAFVTRSDSALLTLRAADCIPLVFYVPGQKILALAHVGRQGAVANLPQKVVSFLKINPAKIKVYAGPHVSQKSYRFDPDGFDKKLPGSWDKYISREADGIHIDLLQAVIDELKSAGVSEENVQISDVDTAGNNNYFSHRRHKLTGEVNGRNAFGVCLI